MTLVTSWDFSGGNIKQGESWEDVGLIVINIFLHVWVFPKIGVPQNGWFIMENPIKMDDLGVPLFLETPIYLQEQWHPCGTGNHRNDFLMNSRSNVQDTGFFCSCYDFCFAQPEGCFFFQFLSILFQQIHGWPSRKDSERCRLTIATPKGRSGNFRLIPLVS